MDQLFNTAFHRAIRFAPLIGFAALVELMAESILARFGIGALTAASPLSYRDALVEVPGSLWFLALVAWGGRRDDRSDAALRANGVRYLWSILGVAALGASWWYWLQQPTIVAVKWQYSVATVCTLLLFFDLGTRPVAPLRHVLSTLPGDLRRLLDLRGVTTSVVAALIVSMGPTSDDARALRPRALTGQALLEWYDQQPKLSLPKRLLVAPVVVATLIDYQCPACASAHRELSPVFSTLQSEYGDQLGLITIDFPLDASCNARPGVIDLHPLACHAAALVRLHGDRRTPYVEWLFSNQASLTRESMGGPIPGLEGAPAPSRIDYEAARLDVVSDAAIAYDLGVRATPTFLVDGVLVERRPAFDMERLIRHVMAKPR